MNAPSRLRSSLDVAPSPRADVQDSGINLCLSNSLKRGVLHEVYALLEEDAASAAGFAIALAFHKVADKPLFWIRDEHSVRNLGRLNGAGLVELGHNPDGIIVVHTPDALSTLRVGIDVANCSGVGAVIIDLSMRASAFDLTASRRLALAAERSGVLLFVLRIGGKPTPSVAAMRWSVSSAKSLSEGRSVRPVLDISLLRHRGGIQQFSARVEWDRDRKTFCDAQISSPVLSFSTSRTCDEIWKRAA